MQEATPTIRLGILHSLTGTTAISETPMVEGAQMAVEELNQSGGVLGYRVEALLRDGASNPATYAARAEELLTEMGVCALFGCWTSASRKAVKAVVEKYQSALWYPLCYEGLEQSPNVLYTNTCLNQQIEPGVQWAIANGARNSLIVGSDYVYPRTSNMLIRGLVENDGGKILDERYIPITSTDFSGVVDAIRRLHPDCVFSTVAGEGNLSFFRELAQAGISAEHCRVMSFAVSEIELQYVAKEAAGHFACWSYFGSQQTAANQQFLRRMRRRYGENRIASDPMVSAYTQIHLWASIVRKIGSFDAGSVLQHACGQGIQGPAGWIELQANNHVAKDALVGRATLEGEFQIVWRSPGPIMPKPWLGAEDLKGGASYLIRVALGGLTEAVHLNWKLDEEIKKRREIEESLRQAMEAAETANRAKSAFLASMSHELRTPMNAILGFSGLMQRDPSITASQREDLDIINRSGDYLLSLINDVLDMSKIEAGPIRLEIAPFDLGAMVSNLMDLMRGRAEEKGLQLQLEQSSEFPRFIRADEAKLRQVLVNLLGNAVKYTPAGSVVLRLESQLDSSGLRLVFEVEDSGIGIAPDDRARIFEPFVQVGTPSTQKGTGLGLTIARQIVHLMGGSISVESTLGKGSIFRAEVPVERAGGEDVLPQEPSKGEVVGLAPGQNEYRILVVEDQRENALLLRRLLERIGFQVEVAPDGTAGIAAYQRWRPHFIWMDRQMPVMDGVEATRRIRDLPGGKDVKIAAITASVFKEQRDELLAAGMDDFVRKPFRPSEVYDSMARLLGVRYRYAETSDEPAPAGALRPEMLAGLPDDLRRELEGAVISLDRNRIDAAIRQVLRYDAALGKTLANHAQNYNFTPILKALQRP